MAQIFHRSTNTFARLSIFGAAFAVAGLLYGAAVVHRSPWMTGAQQARQQPVPFSHKHHVGELGLDCRYCHTSVETSAYAGIPPTETCMNCHREIWKDSPMLEPVRASLGSDESIVWTKVHDLPDFVYFDHSIHVAKGVGCASCHGEVDEMNLTWQHASLQMEWCLTCHRNPAAEVRPRDKVFDMNWQPDSSHDGAALVKAHGIKTEQLDNCSICHR